MIQTCGTVPQVFVFQCDFHLETVGSSKVMDDPTFISLLEKAIDARKSLVDTVYQCII